MSFLGLKTGRASAFIGLLSVCFFHANLHAMPAVVKVDSLHYSRLVINEVAILEDPTAQYTIQDVLTLSADQFTYFQGRNLHLGFNQSIFWLRIKINNNLALGQTIALVTQNPLLDHLDYFYTDSDGVVIQQHLGDRVPLEKRTYPLLEFTGSIPFEANQTQDVYIRVQSNGALSLPIMVISEAVLPLFFSKHEWINGAYFGLAIAMVLYNFLLWIKVRERIYLEYVACVASQVAFIASFSGYMVIMFSGNILLLDKGLFLLAVPVVIAFLQFTRTFLNLMELSPTLDKVFVCCMAVSLLMIPVYVALPTHVVVRLNMALVILTVFFILGVSLKRFTQGYGSTAYFFFGHVVFVTCILFTVASALNVLPFYNYAHSIIKFGSACEMVMFSMSLAARIDTLKTDKFRLEQEKKLEHEKSVASEKHLLELSQMNKQLEKALQVRSEFLANVSHEIRTPMNGVLGMLELMDDPNMNSIQSHYLETAKRSGRTLLELIDDVLELSKIEAGELALDMNHFSIREFCNDLTSLYTPIAQSKRLELVLNVDAFVPDTMICDRVRLWQVMTNLLSNAIKFTHKGKVTIRISLDRSQGNRIRFSVKDTGVGVAPESQGLIFESFKQADGTHTREYGGTGLGLSISQKLVILMGGELKIRSKLGQGSEFSFMLPCVMEENEPLLPQTNKAQEVPMSAPVSESELRVLLVEDNAVNQAVAVGMLRKLGIISVIAVCSGVEALVVLKQAKFDLVLMDIQMPDMDGYETTRCIRELEGAAAQTPIIAMTANAMDGDREKCIEAGMNDYLSKPIRLELLKEIIEKYGSRKDNIGTQQAV